MQIHVFGNPDIQMDALPLRLPSPLQKALPQHDFVCLDPNENWEVPRHMYIIDTVVGLEEPRVFEGLQYFLQAPRMTCHDFDAYANIVLLQKLRKVDDVTVFGLPPNYDHEKAVAWLTTNLSSLPSEKDSSLY